MSRQALVLFSLLTATSAIRFFQLAADSTYSWSVTNWLAGCDGSNCSYAFDVSGSYEASSDSAIPGFAAHCAGNGVGVPYRLCNVSSTTNSTARKLVAAKLLPTNATQAQTALLAISYRFDDLEDEGIWWNYTGFAEQTYNGRGVSAEPVNFTVTPTEVRAAG